MGDANGVGLAATQAGVLRRVFVFQPDDEDEPRRGRQPAHRRARATRSRPTTRAASRSSACSSRSSAPPPVTLEAHRRRGRGAVRLELEGLGARVVQHELDHLDGVLILDRTTPEARREAMAALRPRPLLGGSGAARLRGHRAVRRRRARAAGGAPRDRVLLTQPDAPQGRGRRLGAAAGEGGRGALGIPVARRSGSTPTRLPADTIVLVAYGRLIPGDLLERHLWLNVHPSLLPRWRGAAPVERAIMAGDAETGVTIHRTVEELDAGPIAAQRAFPIGPTTTPGASTSGPPRSRAELLERGAARAVVPPAAGGGRHVRREARPGGPRARPLRPGGGGATACGRSRRTSARAPSSRAAA